MQQPSSIFLAESLHYLLHCSIPHERIIGVVHRSLRGAAGEIGNGRGPKGAIPSLDEDVQNTFSGRLLGGGLAGVVGDIVPINDVVPVSLTSLEGIVSEFECSLPHASLVVGKRELGNVVVP